MKLLLASHSTEAARRWVRRFCQSRTTQSRRGVPSEGAGRTATGRFRSRRGNTRSQYQGNSVKAQRAKRRTWRLSSFSGYSCAKYYYRTVKWVVEGGPQVHGFLVFWKSWLRLNVLSLIPAPTKLPEVEAREPLQIKTCKIEAPPVEQSCIVHM